MDRDTWFTADFAKVPAGVPPGWNKEYSFSALWRLPGLTLANLVRLAARIGNDERARAEWYSTYPVGRTANWHVPGVASLPPLTFRAYYCAIGHVEADAYRRCLCGAAWP